MLAQTKRSPIEILSPNRIIPVAESRTQLLTALTIPDHNAIFIRHCDLFEIKLLCQQATHRGYSLYINVDHINGIYPDIAGLQYLIEQFHITGIISTSLKVLMLGKVLGLHTIFHIFAADSTGLGSALEMIDTTAIDLFDVSPALVVPSISVALKGLLPHPFIASGLISTKRQVQAVLQAGALGVAVIQPELW